MAESSHSPILNPVLRLDSNPVSSDIQRRGKGRETVFEERWKEQQPKLWNDVNNILCNRSEVKLFGSKKFLMKVTMFANSLAPTHTPNDLLSELKGMHLISPYENGYLVESDFDKLEELQKLINELPNWKVKSDVSRVESIDVFGINDVLRGRTIDALWENSQEGYQGHKFEIFLKPFQDNLALDSIITAIEELEESNIISPIQLTGPVDSISEVDTQISIFESCTSKIVRAYRQSGVSGRGIIEVSSVTMLEKLIESETLMRLDPACSLQL